MSDLSPLSPAFRRPRLLMCAARHGLQDYRRERDLPRILGGYAPEQRPLPALISTERALEDQRKRNDATYSCTRHVEVMIALLAELTLTAQSALQLVRA